ncbi:fluoride efflux transporter CrcB [Dyadobacter flavalbus]|uniref:Fluoride-specific ion channel FluC n=1 Tax=Dyadobacter flavalbus TaxID=2579942 RepID=A0A5M8R1V2_9BACT|nr:fluoride efflux transporter CrcB [Dyadobacter flavalbus]KAA6440162.1 fluoride efflux transporter CrcB [Dyadobacter flavalbus]
MKHLILVFIGGGLGSLARYGTGKASSVWPSNFPYGTLTANILACLILGVFTGWAAFRTPDSAATYRAFIAVGFCGGFSTFSTFSNDTIQLMAANRWTDAVFNIFASLISCFCATVLGMWLGKQLLNV